MSSVAVRFAVAADMAAVCDLINHYIATTTINFHTSPLTTEEWVADWEQHHARYPWLVATRRERVVGVAYAAPWKTRVAYGWSAEVTVYVAPDCARQGVGRLLYERLFEVLDGQGYHTQLAVIALPNDPSIAMHEAFGFRHVGTLREVGHKHGSWRDVGFWQRCARPSDQVAAEILPVPHGVAP
jgi:phosphinothricin acetyltransferase